MSNTEALGGCLDASKLPSTPVNRMEGQIFLSLKTNLRRYNTDALDLMCCVFPEGSWGFLSRGQKVFLEKGCIATIRGTAVGKVQYQCFNHIHYFSDPYQTYKQYGVVEKVDLFDPVHYILRII